MNRATVSGTTRRCCASARRSISISRVSFLEASRSRAFWHIARNCRTSRMVRLSRSRRVSVTLQKYSDFVPTSPTTQVSGPFPACPADAGRARTVCTRIGSQKCGPMSIWPSRRDGWLLVWVTSSSMVAWLLNPLLLVFERAAQFKGGRCLSARESRRGTARPALWAKSSSAGRHEPAS